MDFETSSCWSTSIINGHRKESSASDSDSSSDIYTDGGDISRCSSTSTADVPEIHPADTANHPLHGPSPIKVNAVERTRNEAISTESDSEPSRRSSSSLQSSIQKDKEVLPDNLVEFNDKNSNILGFGNLESSADIKARAKALRLSSVAVAQVTTARRNLEPYGLKNVDYMSTVDVASHNYDLSTTGPIAREKCESAFNATIPSEVPLAASSFDDLSTIHPLSMKSPHKLPKKNKRAKKHAPSVPGKNLFEEALLPDEENAIDAKPKMESGAKQDGRCDQLWNMCINDRSDVEIILIAVIMLSLIAMMTLLVLIALKKTT